MRSLFLGELRLYLCNRVVSQIPSHAFRLWFYRHVMRFRIGKDSTIFMGAWFDAADNFSIGENSVINQGCRLDTRGGIHIGNLVIVTAGVTILTVDHDPSDPSFATSRHSPVVLKDYVFVATNAMILRGVTIGHGAVVGAGAVVTRDVEDYAIVAGNPARTIGRRPENLSYNPTYRRTFW